MTLTQAFFGGLLVLLLLVVAVVAGSKQLRLLHSLNTGEQLEEAKHLRRRAWRRLVCSVLMAVLGLLLTAAMLWLESPAQRLRDLMEEIGPVALEDPERRLFARLYGWYWVGFLFLLLVLLLLAGWDLWAVRRHGRKQMRRLQQDRRDMIARETAQMRQQRGRES